MNRSFPTLTAALAVLALAGCEYNSASGEGGIRQQLGLDAGAPDEFLIIANAPLELPPSFDLPRPTPGAKSRVAPDPEGDARTALFQTPTQRQASAPSAGEQILLTGARATGDNSAIRETLVDEVPDSGNRQFLLTSILGFAIPANLDDVDGALLSAEEVEALRQQGYLVPAAPPPPQEKSIDE